MQGWRNRVTTGADFSAPTQPTIMRRCDYANDNKKHARGVSLSRLLSGTPIPTPDFAGAGRVWEKIIFMSTSVKKVLNSQSKNATKKSQFWGQIWGQNHAGGMFWGDKMTNIVR
ncbi:hypothetical protein N4Q52_00775 [Enterobacter mori]|uniref:hypothetical protein n=1 Tax=Enterobacter mori TaxID=539813 RepID=UPI0021B0B561|nr:hypothetical protein [Enterobacter mori]MCT6662533.1 hypothetical protein [Enterobacter mori]